MEPTDLWTLEREAWAEGHAIVCGCDEAGAGPLAGPVYAAAVVLPRELELPGLNDSKKLSAKKRDVLFDLIREQAVSWAVASVDAAEIDETDILTARMKAMQLAIDQLRPHRRQPGQGEGRGHHRAPPHGGEGGQPVRLHRGGLHPGQGEPGPLYGGNGRPVSPVRL